LAVPTSEPSALIAGESWQWDIDDDEFPASTWTLVYDFLSHATAPTKIEITAGAWFRSWNSQIETPWWFY